jgi:hypothetical protein
MINTKFKIGDEITLPEALKYQVKEILRVVAVEKFQDGWGYVTVHYKVAESGERTDVLGVVRIMHESEDKFVLYSFLEEQVNEGEKNA